MKQANAVSPNSVLNYNLTMAYSPAGRIDTLSLTSTALKNGYQTSENYTDVYSYDVNNNPYAVKTINDNKFCWDRLGNMSAVYCKEKPEELMYWTEDNRMQSYNNIANGHAGFYRYDASGQRELKLTGKVSDINPMGRPYYYVDFQDAVLYAGNLMTIDKGGYKKHYFMESERFLTTVGGGRDGQANIAVDTEIDGIEPRQPREMSNIYTKFVTNYFTEHEHSCERTMNAENILKNIPQLEKIFREATQQSISDLHYYLHNDRLGSGSVVTNGSGNAAQVLDYQPFGQDFLEMSAGFQTDFRFGGKITDQESGLMQFEDRYRKYGSFYTTDRLWFKYPCISPYNFCAWNPIMFIDPTGMKIDPSDMSDEERANYTSQVETMRQGSKLFNTMYSQLETSENVYKVNYGQTGDGGGQFEPNDAGNGGTITFEPNSNGETDYQVFAEEHFHALQLVENKGKYGGEFNTEFEAKIFDIAVVTEIGVPIGYHGGARNFETNISMGVYGNENANQLINPLNFTAPLSFSFLNDYNNTAHNFAIFHTINDTGANSHYKTRTTVAPYSLMQVVNGSYGK